MTISALTPDWPLPARVRACISTRDGGVSQPPYTSLNLALHVGDESARVEENRRLLAAALALPASPRWLTQVHGVRCVNAADTSDAVEADASYATEPGVVCAVLTADCLPILLCDRAGSTVAAVHAGWRGLHDGVIAGCLGALPCRADQLLAWIGPGIGVHAYTVGAELRAAFLALDAAYADCFRETDGAWQANLAGIARKQLAAAGISTISQYAGCTYREHQLFYSYRRENRTGRFASLIWIV